jgi:hypothetical protein
VRDLILESLIRGGITRWRGPALGGWVLRKVFEKSQDPLFYPAPVQAVRPLRAAGAWCDGAREASSNHLLPRRKLERRRAGGG